MQLFTFRECRNQIEDKRKTWFIFGKDLDLILNTKNSEFSEASNLGKDWDHFLDTKIF